MPSTRHALFRLPLCLGLLLFSRVEAKAQTPVVPIPRSFEAVAVSVNEIRCYWLPADGATGYRIQRDGQTIATLPANAQEYDDRSLPPNTVHHYTIQVLQGEQVSAPITDVDCTFTYMVTPRAYNRRNLKSDLFPTNSYDVVIVQASSGGVAAAVEAAKRGLKVALVEPTTRLGGMPVNGLSSTDLRRDFHASGFLVRFADRVQQLYAREGVKTNGLRYEPRIAHKAMKSLVFEQPNITVFRRMRSGKRADGEK